MPMAKHFGTAQDAAGNILPGASVVVTEFDSGDPVTIYEDDETTPISQPIIADSKGMFGFCADAGTYDVAVSYAGETTTISHVTLGVGEGADGAGYEASSTTSLTTAGSGSKVFTTQAGLAYSAGARIRATSTGSGDWMEGLVTSYSGTTLTVTMDLNSGTGTRTDWNINLAGERGSTGAAGSTRADEYAGHIEAPAAKTYTLSQYASAAGTIERLVADLGAGTCTLNLQINGVSVTSISAVAQTTTESNTAATGANTVVAGDTITLIVTSPSSAADLTFSVIVNP